MVGCIISTISVNCYKAGHISRYQQPGGDHHMVFRVGEVHGRVTERATELAKILNAVDSANVTQNLWGERWTKLTANTITHGLLGATGLDNRSVYIERGTAHRIGIKLAAEAIAKGGRRVTNWVSCSASSRTTGSARVTAMLRRSKPCRMD